MKWLYFLCLSFLFSRIYSMDLIDIGTNITAAVSFVWKTICNEKTDEELLQDFNNTINNEQVSQNTRMKIVRRVMHRLVDCKKEMPLRLLKSALEQYKNNNPIVVSALIFNKQTSQDDKYTDRRNDFIYQSDFNDPVSHIIFDRALKKTNREALKILFSYELYSCESYGIHPLLIPFELDEFTKGMTTLREKYKPVVAIFNIPESEEKKSCIKFLFQQNNHSKMFAEIPQRHYISQNDNSYRYNVLKIEHEEQVEKYMTLCLPCIKNSTVITKALSRVGGSAMISPDRYKRLQKLLLEAGAKPSYDLYRFKDDEYPLYYSFPYFVRSRIDGVAELLCYGGEIDDNYVKDIESKKNKFRAIHDTEFLYLSAVEVKNIICLAFDEIATKIGKEKEFREQFFNYNHQKNYPVLLETLRQDYPRPAWWIMRVLGDRNCDITITDMSHIPQFCFDQMNILFSSNMSDRDVKREIRSWKELMIFLLSKTPDIFKDKKVQLESSDHKEYIVHYKDKKKKLEKLMLRIVEQGYFARPKTYKSLRSLLIHCIESDEFILDISAQNGREGSIIHIFSRLPFDMPMLRMIFKIYDPRSLYLACSENNKTTLFGLEKSTPKDIIAEAMLEQCDDQEQYAYQEVLDILQYGVLTVKQKASMHCPYVDTVSV